MNRRIVLAIGLVLILGLVFYCGPREPKVLPTYFAYSEEEVEVLRFLKSSETIKAEDLYEWDRLTFKLVSDNTLTTGFDPNTAKIYAYLAVAQKDAAFLSFNSEGEFTGSLAPVSKEVLCIFFPKDCADIGIGKEDEYSRALAKIVMSKVNARIAEDEARIKPYEQKKGEEYWDWEEKIGIADGSRKPWFLESGNQFRASPPLKLGSEEFMQELALVKKAVDFATQEQKQAVVFWAGGPGTKTAPGIWLEIADSYMKQNNAELEKVLSARAKLSMTIADAVIAVFDSKYSYYVKRPFMVDKTIFTIMPTPSHPSYPSGHSTVSAAASGILSYYFPEQRDRWAELAQEAGISRVWGGIHFPMDDKQGTILGTKVAEEALRRPS